MFESAWSVAGLVFIFTCYVVVPCAAVAALERRKRRRRWEARHPYLRNPRES